jgi:hypothetical protein
MKCKLNVAVMIIAMCLITTATHAQRLHLILRFRVPFPFNVENTTFPAGEYEVTQPGQFTLAVRNVENQASVFAPVEPAASANKANGRARTVFHRYGGNTSWRQYPMDRGSQAMTSGGRTKRRNWPVTVQRGNRKWLASSPNLAL